MPREPRDDVDELSQLSIPELIEIILQQQALLARQAQRLAELEEQVEQLQRAGKRQATPFARQQPKANPQPPGRQAGQGCFTYRTPPPPETITQIKEEFLAGCPHCGGALSDLRDCKTHQHFEVDIPAVQPCITRYVTHSGYCLHCRVRVRSRHPEQISQATGAAGVAMGPRAKALAADLKHRLGVPYGKIEELFEVAFGLPCSRGGLCQADARLAQQARPLYDELIELLRHSAQVHADETGWRIGTLSAWLWVFTNRQLTVYTVQSGRGHARSHEVVIEILGEEFAGTLISDCFTAYDHQKLAGWLKQKCVAHLLKDLSQMEAAKSGPAVCFARQVSAVLRDALALRDQKQTLAATEFSTQAQQLEAQLDGLIEERRRLSDADNRRFAKRLRKQRAHLLRFLYDEGTDATNNQAERMLRPAVITRKTGGCNRSAQGAQTHAILASVLVTCNQQKLSLLDFLVKLQRAVGGVLPTLAPAPAAAQSAVPP
jgi:transposase